VLFNKIQTVKLLGAKWVALRLIYALRLWIGQLERKTPIQRWNQVHAPQFSGLVLLIYSKVKNENTIQHAKEVLSNEQRYFFHHYFSFKTVPDWFENPFQNIELSKLKTTHWSKISDFTQGDIKCIWELSRFAWVYPLARAYSLACDESYSNAFWHLFEDWAQKNPPNNGVHWKCGQEIAVRMMALTTGYFAIKKSKKTTHERVLKLRQVLYSSTKRIEANIDYALNQNNNHGISEATGLFTGGVLFGDKDWIKKGQNLLEHQVLDLVYSDGSFSQHSANYHRVMIHACLWAIQLGRANGINFSEGFIEKVRLAGQWLLALFQPKNGYMPNLGSNDGALILPYSTCDYLDFRPTIQAVGAVVDGSNWLPSGPWDDLAHWLVPGFTGCSSVKNRNIDDGTPLGQDKNFTMKLLQPGGYAIWNIGDAKLIFRCPVKFLHRPAQCDLLHIDLWRNGVNIFRDAGTYSYNCEQPWQDYFKSTAAHNTVQFDDHDQMPKISRFLYGQWPVLSIELNETLNQIKAGFTDWRGCFHRRSITPLKNGFKVIDRIAGRFNKAVLRWRLAPEKNWNLDENVCMTDGISMQIECSEKGKMRLVDGWESLYYMDKKKLPVIETTVGKSCKAIITHITIT
jgi:hypothetical protein